MTPPSPQSTPPKTTYPTTPTFPLAAAFADQLAARLNSAGTVACVGLDPDLERIPAHVRKSSDSDAQAIERFCLGVIDAVAPIVGVVKPQAACFERFGSQGVAALERVCIAARDAGLIVILDAKRGDIGVSARHYAASAANAFKAHAITLNPYLGMETIEPYLELGLGVFVLVRTSNPGSDELQNHPVVTTSDNQQSPATIAEVVAMQTAELGGRAVGSATPLSAVGAVVGATKAEQGARLRALMPNQVFLVPGFGAQGGTTDDIRKLVRPDAKTPGNAGVIVNSSRAVLYPQVGDNTGSHDWISTIETAARAFVDQLRGVVSATNTETT